MIEDLAARRACAGVALVVAHPDDETLALGGLFAHVPGLLLVHVTDGSPRALPDAARHGMTTAHYAAARAAELDQAMAVADVPGLQRVMLGIADQDAALHIGTIATALAGLFYRHAITTVMTHAYEGGHPDHDATACAVHRAAGDCSMIEFVGYRADYHSAEDGVFITDFLPGPAGMTITLTRPERTERRAMLDCFATQADMLARFSDSAVQLRPAPRYDFAQPPHPGLLNYERWGWPMTGARFRSLAEAGGA